MKETFRNTCVVLAMLFLIYMGLSTWGIFGLAVAGVGAFGLYTFIKEQISK